MVDVSENALKSLRDALAVFSADIEGVYHRAVNYSDEIAEECKAHIEKTKSLITEAEEKISNMSKMIESFEAEITCATNESNAVLSSISATEKKISSLKTEVSSLRTRISALHSQMANAKDDGQKQSIQAQINALERQMHQCEAEQNRLENELIRLKQTATKLQGTINAAKSQKFECETELSTEKNKYNRLRGKLERLNASFDRVENDLNAYVESTRRFEGYASDKVSHNISALEKCMQSIEEYLSTSFHGAQNSSAATVTAGSQSSPDAVERSIFELNTLRSNMELGDGDPDYPQVGGIYGKIKTMHGFERHHIPSNAVQDDRRENLPVILISREDHHETDSYAGRQNRRHEFFIPGTPSTDTYRNEAADEIRQGNYIDLVRDEIYNIIDKCGHRYDGAIRQYFDALEEYIRNNGIPNPVYRR